MRPLALLTDFGLAHPYAGQLRAALFRHAPAAPVLDITHRIEPFAVDQAAFFLAASAPFFPEDTVFVSVVDPGVGSSRRIVGAQIAGQDFLAPDNGLLSLLLSGPDGEDARVYDLSDAAEAYAASATFHGRDVFAPLAARLAKGESLAALGEALPQNALVRQDWAEPKPTGDGMEVRVLHVDRYGNCLLSMRPSHPLPQPLSGLRMSWGQRRPLTIVRTYADLGRGEIGLLAGSQGFLELAVNQGSAAEALCLRRGDAIRLLWSAAK